GALRLMVDGAGHGLMVAARRAVDQPALIGLGSFADVVPKPRGSGALAKQDAVGPVARFAKQFLRDAQLVFEGLVPLAKLLLQLPNREMRPDPREDLFRLEGLVDEVHRAQVEAPRFLARLGERRQKDDCAVTRAISGLQAGAPLA